MSGFEIPKDSSKTNSVRGFSGQLGKLQELREKRDSLYAEGMRLSERRDALYESLPQEVKDAYQTKLELDRAIAKQTIGEEIRPSYPKGAEYDIPEIEAIYDNLNKMKEALKDLKIATPTPEEKIKTLENKLKQQLQALSPEYRELYQGMIQIDNIS